jgi:hypothetical protein
MQNKGLGVGLIGVGVIALLLFLGAQPVNVLGVPNTVTTTVINSSSSGDVQVVAASGSQSIYITNYLLFSSGTTTAQFDYGTGSNCASGTTTVDGPISLIAQTGVSAGSGLGAVIAIPSGNALCLNLGTGSVQVGGHVSWAYGP